MLETNSETIIEPKRKVKMTIEGYLAIVFMSIFLVATAITLLLLYGCTNVVMTHTEGAGASESLEDAQAPSNTLSIPFIK